jgi:hypothetical protein
MKKRLIILAIIFLLTTISILIYLYTNKLSADLVAERLVKLYPNSVIEHIERGEGICVPDKTIVININREKIFICEFKNRKAAEDGFLVLTEAEPRENFVADYKGTVAIKYSGSSKEISGQFKGLLK